MKRIIFIVIIAVAGYQYMRATSNQQPSQPIANDVDLGAIEAPKTVSLFGSRSTDNSWPTLPDNASADTDSLMASNYYLVIDGSGSMRRSTCSDGQSKMDVAKNAISSFIASLPTNANLGLYVFDGKGIGERLKLAPIQKPKAFQAVSDMTPSGSTPLSLGIAEGYAALNTQAAKQLGYGEYHLVVITDGNASKGYEPNKAVNRLLSESPVVLHTIGFCIDSQHALNQEGLTLYKSANNPEELSSGLQAVLAEAPDFQVINFEP